jgi:hypothetical protein
MKTKTLLIFSIVTFLETSASLYYLLVMEFTPGRGGIINYETLRGILAGVLGITAAGLAIFTAVLFVKPNIGQALSRWLDKSLVEGKKRLFFIQGGLIILTIFLGECFLLSYLAFPEPTRPLLLLAALLCLEGWIFLRAGYAGEYRMRPNTWARMRAKWSEWEPVQRRTFLVLVLLGLIYFSAFIPGNLLKDQYGNFYMHGDEKVVYPEVVADMVFPKSLPGMVHGVLEGWGWQYGYPYFTAAAAILLIPRLIFGSHFAEQVQLNVFLLRQFLNVVPMTLAMGLVVYMATRFKNLLAAAGAFLFMALLPGIVKYNYRFFHPDALIVLLVVLAIYALQKDNLRFGRWFHLAAVFCAISAAIKLWGFFFGPVIAGYLVAGILKKRLTPGKMVLSGGLFLLTMLAAFIISSPTLMAPYIARVAMRSWMPRQGFLFTGFNEQDPGGDYQKGLLNWMPFFSASFMQAYFFFFCYLGLIGGSLWGKSKTLNRILLGWCGVTGIFLIYFVAIKNFQYMLPLAVPLCAGAMLFPTATGAREDPKMPVWLAKPLTRKLAVGMTLAMVVSQFAINLVLVGQFVTGLQ